MKVAVVRESYPGEQRVALIPANVAHMKKLGLDVLVESGAGDRAGFLDADYSKAGATVVDDRSEALTAEIVVQVRALGANPHSGREDLTSFHSGQVVIGMCDPLGNAESASEISKTGASVFSLELIPRITRAQSMDVLSSMATIAGYRAVLLAAVELPKMFPMMMTAAGTLSPARVFVIGAGVAGLQAIATAKRLGGVVRAYDVRPAVREQVESLGGKFVELELESGQAEDKGGYAKQLGEEFYQKQRELMARVVADSDVVITTAAIPGKPSPLLITADAVAGMSPGSVIIDLAAERGGNCEPSKPDERVDFQGVVVLGPTNLPAEIPNHASQMFSNNITKFLSNLVKDGEVNMNLDDEIIHDTLITKGGEVVNARLRESLGLEALKLDQPKDESPETKEPEKDTIPFPEGDDNESVSQESGDASGEPSIADKSEKGTRDE
jgi:NAD(P) transhydrogenase subunit alpha